MKALKYSAFVELKIMDSYHVCTHDDSWTGWIVVNGLSTVKTVEEAVEALKLARNENKDAKKLCVTFNRQFPLNGDITGIESDNGRIGYYKHRQIHEKKITNDYIELKNLNI